MIKRIIDKQTKLFIRDDFNFDEETEIGLEVEPSQGLHIPKWNGETWVEGATQEYVDSLTTMQPEPTETERIEALEQALLEFVLGGAF